MDAPGRGLIIWAVSLVTACWVVKFGTFDEIVAGRLIAVASSKLGEVESGATGTVDVCTGVGLLAAVVFRFTVVDLRGVAGA
jgi:hypothetical protein